MWGGMGGSWGTASPPAVLRGTFSCQGAGPSHSHLQPWAGCGRGELWQEAVWGYLGFGSFTARLLCCIEEALESSLVPALEGLLCKLDFSIC